MEISRQIEVYDIYVGDNRIIQTAITTLSRGKY